MTTEWGFWKEGRWVQVPKIPIQRAGLTPPVTVTVPGGEVRHLVEREVMAVGPPPEIVSGECAA